MAVNFFRDLYAPESLLEISMLLPKSSFIPLSSADLTALNKPFSSSEIEKSIRGMAPFKSPGPMRDIISKLVGPAQCSFIPGRLISDNVVVVQEVVHSMRKKQG
ncbi:hypothetical protein V2J09_009291 [Rumex salicifolius]